MNLKNFVKTTATTVFVITMLSRPVYADETDATLVATVESPNETNTVTVGGTAEEPISLEESATDGGAAQNTPETAIVMESLEDETTTTPKVIEASTASTSKVGPGFINLVATDEAESESGEGEVIWMGWTVFESGNESYAQTGGDGGHAFGRFQFDSRYDLAGFLQKCINYDEAYARFGQFITTKSGRAVMRTRSGLGAVWKQIYSERPDEFSLLQIEYAAETYYYSVKEALLNTYGINIDEYGPVLKGTMWSVALRDGNNVHTARRYNNLRTVVETYTPGIDEETWLRAIYAAEAARHPNQSGRWNAGQLSAALGALGQCQQVEVTRGDLPESGEFEVIV